MAETTLEIKQQKLVIEIMTIDQFNETLEWVDQDLELEQAFRDGWEILNLTVLGDRTFTQRLFTLKRTSTDGE